MSDNLALAERFHRDIFTNDDYEAADEILAPDFTWSTPGLPPSAANREGLKQFARSLREAFPHYRLTHDDTIVAGDKVVIRWTNHGGTHEGTFLGVAPTQAAASAEGVDIFRIEGGRIVELYEIWDQVGVMSQLGVVPQNVLRFT